MSNAALAIEAGVFALDMDGAMVWEKRFEPRTTRMGWGTAASPVLHDDTLYIVNDNDDDSFVVALDTATGEEQWRVDRDEGCSWLRETLLDVLGSPRPGSTAA